MDAQEMLSSALGQEILSKQMPVWVVHTWEGDYDPSFDSVHATEKGAQARLTYVKAHSPSREGYVTEEILEWWSQN